ncbi:MAG: hypothetical protein JRG70_04575 [Deltaproteobacteria bacterium]|nr:hypothetical protein [Deltaproteobacteria bacterium]
MSRFILVATLMAVTVAGCNRFPDNGLQIAANLPPDDACLLSPDQDSRLLRGRYDLSYAGADYLIALLLQSFLISNALEFQGEQGNLQVTNFDITLLLPDGTIPTLPDGLVNPYRVDTSAVLPVSEGGTPSEDVAAAIGIPASYQDALRGLLAGGQSSILLDIRAGGTTAGGFSQRSGPFLWPVDLCEGCLGVVCETIDELDETSCLKGQDIWPYCASVVPPTPTPTL